MKCVAEGQKIKIHKLAKIKNPKVSKPWFWFNNIFENFLKPLTSRTKNLSLWYPTCLFISSVCSFSSSFFCRRFTGTLQIPGGLSCVHSWLSCRKSQPVIISSSAFAILITRPTYLDLSIPIYHAIYTQHFRHLRPMYASHNLLIIYIFLPISDNGIVCLMGLMTSVCYTIVMVLVSYASDEHKIIKVLSEVFFLICINLMGIFFRLTNEIDIRRTFLDRRECVQKNLSLMFERNQEKELLLSILPEHIAEKMEKDIKNMIERLKQRRRTGR